MAEDHADHKGLSKIFNVHNLHWLMIGGMAVGAVAMTGGVAAAATLPDLAVATVDSGWQMLTGLEHIFSVGADVVSSTAQGDFSLNYEWGSAAHDMGGMEHAAHGAATHGTQAAAGAAEFGAHAGHAAHSAAPEIPISDKASDFLGLNNE